MQQQANGFETAKGQTFKFLAAIFVLLFILLLEFARRNSSTSIMPSARVSHMNAMVNAYNATRVYSPIIMNKEWSTLGRLVTIIFATCFGATMNTYFISSFFIEVELRRVGNVFFAFVGVADLLINGGVFPITAAVMLSGEWDTLPVCRALQALTSASTYMYSIFFTLVAGEMYARVLHTQLYFVAGDGKLRTLLVVLTVMALGIGLGITGTYWDMDYDYCTRLHVGDFNFRVATTIVHGICGLLTLYGLITSSIQIREYNRVRTRYRRAKQFQNDIELIKLHITAYVTYALAWTPYVIIVYLYPDASDGKFYQFACVGIIRSLLTSMYYGSLYGSFSKAYSNIFYYTCCKYSLNTYTPRQRRVNENNNANRPVVRDVRTHILQVVNSPQRGTAAIQETIDL